MDPEVYESLFAGDGTDILVDTLGAGHKPRDRLAGGKAIDDMVDSSTFLGIADEVLESDLLSVDAQSWGDLWDICSVLRIRYGEVRHSCMAAGLAISSELKATWRHILGDRQHCGHDAVGICWEGAELGVEAERQVLLGIKASPRTVISSPR